MKPTPMNGEVKLQTEDEALGASNLGAKGEEKAQREMEDGRAQAETQRKEQIAERQRLKLEAATTREEAKKKAAQEKLELQLAALKANAPVHGTLPRGTGEAIAKSNEHVKSESGFQALRTMVNKLINSKDNEGNG